MAKKDSIDVETGSKLRRLTLSEVRAAEAIFDAMRADREIAEKVADATPDASVNRHRGPERLNDAFRTL